MKRTRKFGPEDYDLLLSMIPISTTLVTTAHILTEVSNLAAQGADGDRLEAIREVLRKHCQIVDERPAPSSEASKHVVFRKLGLTDAAIALLVENEPVTVITEDLELWVHLTKVGADVINFTHHRKLL